MFSTQPAPSSKSWVLQVETELNPAGTAGDRFLLDRMISNLIDNSIRHNLPGGWIRIRTGSINGSAFFTVANNGPFVAEDVIPSLFEPFGRAEARVNPRTGVGIGLSIVDSIAIAHSASVIAKPERRRSRYFRHSSGGLTRAQHFNSDQRCFMAKCSCLCRARLDDHEPDRTS